MKICKILISSIMLLGLFGCEKIDRDAVSAVQSGKAVKKIVCADVEYSYKYDTQGRISSIAYNKLAPEFIFEYQQEDKLVVTYGNYAYTYTYGQGGELLNIEMSFSGLDAGTATFGHSEGLPVSYSLSSDTDSGHLVSSYAWEGGNLMRISSEIYDSPGSVLEFEYSEILNNLDVPVPFYADQGLDINSDSFHYPFMCTKNLPHKITLGGYDSYITYSYEFNSEKDLVRVKADRFSDGKTSSKVYEIEYY